MQINLRPPSPPLWRALLSCSQGSLCPTSTWGVFGFRVVDDWVLQGCYDALVGFLEGCNEVVHFPKMPPVDPGRRLRRQRVRGERGCWVLSVCAWLRALAQKPCPQTCTHTPGKEPALHLDPLMCQLKMSQWAVLLSSIPWGIVASLHWVVSSSVVI